MELKIYNPQEGGYLKKIEWNFEELKEEVTAKAKEYAATVYTDETIKAAKADRATLNKFVEAVKGERTAIRKKLLEPDELFGEQIKELTGIVQGAIDKIDTQIKDYESRQREEKTAKIKEFYEANIHDIGQCLPFDRVMKPQYANASTTMKSIKEEILALIQKVDEGLAILNEVDSPYAGDMKQVFLQMISAPPWQNGTSWRRKRRTGACTWKNRNGERQNVRPPERQRPTGLCRLEEQPNRSRPRRCPRRWKR